MLNYCAIVPARNEEARLAATLRAIRSRAEVQSVIVVDDASTDATARIAEAEGAAETVRLTRRRGKGGALQEGLARAPEEAEAYIFLDADLGDSATELIKLIVPIEIGEADMTVGMLPPDPQMAAEGRTGGGMGFVVGIARAGLLRRTGQEFEQPLAGQRAMRREVIDKMSGRLRTGFGVEVGLTLAARRNGFRIVEVATMFRHRVTGRDIRAQFHRARQLIDVAAALRG
jgi:glycosyltransferase involved in cell wall biosynthesis